jgi:hypothetical protein
VPDQHKALAILWVTAKMQPMQTLDEYAKDLGNYGFQVDGIAA